MRMRLLPVGAMLVSSILAVTAWAQAPASPGEQAPAPISPTDQVTPQADAPLKPTSETKGGQVGESCRARTDCRTGLRCVQQVCRSIHEGAACQGDSQCPDELVCLQQRCVARFAAATGTTAAPAPVTAATTAVADSGIRLQGTHLFAGLSTGGGVTYWKVNNLQFPPDAGGTPDPVDLDTTKAALMIANLHLGIMFDRLEVSFEIAPVTWMPIVDTGSTKRDPILSALFNVGYFIHIKNDFYWPIHGGVGFVAVNTERLGSPWFQARLQPVGIAYHVGDFLLELDIPEVRLATEFGDANLLSAVFTFRALYLF